MLSWNTFLGGWTPLDAYNRCKRDIDDNASVRACATIHIHRLSTPRAYDYLPPPRTEPSASSTLCPLQRSSIRPSAARFLARVASDGHSVHLLILLYPHPLTLVVAPLTKYQHPRSTDTLDSACTRARQSARVGVEASILYTSTPYFT